MLPTRGIFSPSHIYSHSKYRSKIIIAYLCDWINKKKLFLSRIVESWDKKIHKASLLYCIGIPTSLENSLATRGKQKNHCGMLFKGAMTSERKYFHKTSQNCLIYALLAVADWLKIIFSAEYREEREKSHVWNASQFKQSRVYWNSIQINSFFKMMNIFCHSHFWCYLHPKK